MYVRALWKKRGAKKLKLAEAAVIDKVQSEIVDSTKIFQLSFKPNTEEARQRLNVCMCVREIDMQFSKNTYHCVANVYAYSQNVRITINYKINTIS